MGVQSQNWFMDILRQIFGFFDELVYGLFGTVLQGIFDISGLVTNSSIFNGIYKRIYIVLGVFMAFKLAFSFFQYLINPEQMVDKSKGLSKLFIHVFVMLFALMFLPAVLFSGLGSGSKGGLIPRAQQAFLPVLPKVILGTDAVGNSVDETIQYSTESIISSTLATFFHPAKEIDDACKTGTYASLIEIKSTDEFRAKLIESCTVVKGPGQRKFLWIFDVAKVYTYSYLPIISTAVGVLLLFLLLAISIDLAKRCFKLVILEVIAPIPIMSLIDPAASKGESAFSKWSKNVLSTFLDIFIKVGLLYIILVFLDLITTSVRKISEGDADGQLFLGIPNNPSDPNNSVRQGYLVVLLIIGLIYFAKEAPKFIKESMGLKADKGGFLDDVKSFAKTAGVIGGIGVGATAGALRAGAGNLGAAGTALRNGHLGAAAGALLNPASAIKGAIEGGAAGKKGVGKHGNLINAAIQGSKSQAAGNAQRKQYAEVGSTAFGRARARIRYGLTGTTAGDNDTKRLEANKAVGEQYKAFDEFLGKRAMSETISHNGGTNNYKFSALMAAVESNDDAWALANGFAGGASDAREHLDSLTKAAKRQAYTKYGTTLSERDLRAAIDHGTFSPALTAMGITTQADAEKELGNLRTFQLHHETYDKALDEAHLDGASSYDELGQRKTDAANSTMSIKNDNRYERRQANAKAVNKGKK